jgi:hypothetical protein
MSNLSLLEAENKKRRQLLTGWPLLIFSTTLYIVAFLKGFYSFLSNPPDQLSAIFFRPFANLIALLYSAIPGMGRLWGIPPDCNLANWRDPSNFRFYSFVALVFGLMLVGSQLRWSAKNLSGRIASARQKAQEDQWRSEISGRQPRSSAATLLDLIQINISWQDRWWSRPLDS